MKAYGSPCQILLFRGTRVSWGFLAFSWGCILCQDHGNFMCAFVSTRHPKVGNPATRECGDSTGSRTQMERDASHPPAIQPGPMPLLEVHDCKVPCLSKLREWLTRSTRLATAVIVPFPFPSRSRSTAILVDWIPLSVSCNFRDKDVCLEHGTSVSMWPVKNGPHYAWRRCQTIQATEDTWPSDVNSILQGCISHAATLGNVLNQSRGRSRDNRAESDAVKYLRSGHKRGGEEKSRQDIDQRVKEVQSNWWVHSDAEVSTASPTPRRRDTTGHKVVA